MESSASERLNQRRLNWNLRRYEQEQVRMCVAGEQDGADDQQCVSTGGHF
jgi:hypothetical protein